jgi:hypothetical protein
LKIENKDDRILDLTGKLIGRCLGHFDSGITRIDFNTLKSPGCFVTIKLGKDSKSKYDKRYVSPNYSFRKGERITIHFQTNFDGYAIILYEDKSEVIKVFPTTDRGYSVEAKTDRYSYTCEFDENPGIEKFIFILSKNPIKEMELLRRLKSTWNKNGTFSSSQVELLNQLKGRVQKEGEKLKMQFIGIKAFVTMPKAQLDGLSWFRLSLKNLGM